MLPVGVVDERARGDILLGDLAAQHQVQQAGAGGQLLVVRQRHRRRHDLAGDAATFRAVQEAVVLAEPAEQRREVVGRRLQGRQQTLAIRRRDARQPRERLRDRGGLPLRDTGEQWLHVGGLRHLRTASGQRRRLRVRGQHAIERR